VSRVYVIIVNWNGGDDTTECLESLLGLDYPDYCVVVCDNGSGDDSVRKISRWMDDKKNNGSISWQVLDRETAERGGGSPDASFTLILNGENLGFGAGSNVGLRYALSRGDAGFCWLLNNDTVVEPSALTEMVKRLDDKPEAAMCGSTLREYGNRSRIQAMGGASYYKWFGVAWHIGRMAEGNKLPEPGLVEKKMDYVVGASLLVRSSYLQEVGLMAEDYFLYFEEIDWVTRGRGRCVLAYAPKSVVYHKIGASIGTATNPLRKSLQSDYYSLCNRLLFTRRFFPYALPGIYAGLAMELLVRMLLGRWRVAWMVSRAILSGRNAVQL